MSCRIMPNAIKRSAGETVASNTLTVEQNRTMRGTTNFDNGKFKV